MSDIVDSENSGLNEDNDRIIQTDLRNEMSRSYLEYAMSVIVGRALPDARDGLKPCLLYTSPSPRDYAASRMPSSA